MIRSTWSLGGRVLLLLCLIGMAAEALAALSAAQTITEHASSAIPKEPYDVSIVTIPHNVYKEEDGVSGKWPSEGWVFHILVRERKDREVLAKSATVELYSGPKLLKTVQFTEDALSALRGVSFKAGKAEPEISAKRFAAQEEVFDLRHQFSEPTGLNITRLVYRLELQIPGGRKLSRTLEIPITRYQTKTKLLFPIKGDFMVVNGHVAEGGHTEWSQHFAYDIVPLGPHLEMLQGDGTANEHFVGWGREVLAPGDGVVVYSRNDVQDQPKPGNVDSMLFLGLPEPMWAVGGNCIVLDHGNSEFSFLGHMQQGSVRVVKGAMVKHGQVLGLLGSSGSAQGPHLHYHLMAGGVIFRSDGLPSRFINVSEGVPRQGRYSEAK